MSAVKEHAAKADAQPKKPSTETPPLKRYLEEATRDMKLEFTTEQLSLLPKVIGGDASDEKQRKLGRMRIALMTIGSRGDVQPQLALALRVRRAAEIACGSKLTFPCPAAESRWPRRLPLLAPRVQGLGRRVRPGAAPYRRRSRRLDEGESAVARLHPLHSADAACPRSSRSRISCSRRPSSETKCRSSGSGWTSCCARSSRRLTCVVTCEPIGSRLTSSPAGRRLDHRGPSDDGWHPRCRGDRSVSRA